VTADQPEELAVVIYDRRGKRGGLAPVLVHADGTNCSHAGKPKPIASLNDVPTCPAGQPVTEVRFDGRTLTLGQVYRSLKSIAEAWTKLLTPSMSTLLAAVGPMLEADPQIRALAAATAVIDEARRAEAAR
jgi:hypothetical protein